MTKLELSLNDIALSAIILIALILCFSTFNWASADIKSKHQSQTIEKKIMSEYRAAKIRCASFVSKVKTFCDKNADIDKDKSLAGLDSIYVPTPQLQKDIYDEFIIDKTVDSEQFNDKNYPFNRVNLDQIYHVKS